MRRPAGDCSVDFSQETDSVGVHAARHTNASTSHHSQAGANPSATIYRKPVPAQSATVSNLVSRAGESLRMGPEDTTDFFSTLLNRARDA